MQIPFLKWTIHFIPLFFFKNYFIQYDSWCYFLKEWHFQYHIIVLWASSIFSFMGTLHYLFYGKIAFCLNGQIAFSVFYGQIAFSVCFMVYVWQSWTFLIMCTTVDVLDADSWPGETSEGQWWSPPTRGHYTYCQDQQNTLPHWQLWALHTTEEPQG